MLVVAFRPIVAFRDVSKVYPERHAVLRDVSFLIRAGSIHAICENGAGKSTLMKILFGIENATAGEIIVDGQHIASWSPKMPRPRALAWCTSISRSCRLYSYRKHHPRPRVGEGRLIDRVSARKMVEALMQQYDLHADPEAITGALSVAAQQKVENPESAGAPHEAPDPRRADRCSLSAGDRGADAQAGRRCATKALPSSISHKLNEVRELAESVTVLRGAVAGTEKLADVPDDAIMQMVMGHAVDIPQRAHKHGTMKTVLDMKGVTTKAADLADRIKDVNLTVGAGEIVGVAGVDGSGQRGLVSVLSGLAEAASGTISLNGEDMLRADTASWRRQGLAHLPADRFSQGGAPGLSLAEKRDRRNWIDYRRQGSSGAVCGECDQGPGQRNDKAIFGARRRNHRTARSFPAAMRKSSTSVRELATNPKFLIADQPTRGIDVSAAAFLHRRIDEVAQGGCAVLLVSADLDELLRLSDRIVVLFNGRIVAVLENGPDITPAALDLEHAGGHEHDPVA